MQDSMLLQRLLDVSRQMAETRTLDPLLIYAVDVALQLFLADHGYIVLVSEDGTLDFRVKRDRHGNDIAEPERKISYTILRKVVSKQEAVITASAIEDPNFSKADSVEDLQLRSVMCVPLIARGRSVGALYMENRAEIGMFTDSNLESLSYFASQAAVAIENALLNDRLEQMLAERAEQHRFATEHLHQEVIELAQDDLSFVQKLIEQERMRVVANFIQDASHQFRTPLAVINTNTDILSRKLDTNQYGSYLETIQGQVQTIVRLVETLTLMVRLDSRDFKLEDRVDFNSIAQAMVRVKEPFAAAKQQTFTLKLAHEPLILYGNADLLRQALGHLLDNAIAYTPIAGLVEVSLRTMDDRIIVEILDNGVGIDESQRDLIFSRFYRSDTAGTTRGLGLGLAVVAKVLELHEAKIEVESSKNQGSLFRLIFSKEKSHAD